jgi:pSer/pThr/pTyr-binding forkhead associated (FHA) protein
MNRQVRLFERGTPDEPMREIPVEKDEFLIGRAPDCDLRLDVAAVSRHHCMLRVTADEVTLVDLGSSNGTYLNGERVRSQATLKSGDELHIENVVYLVDLGDGELKVRGTDPLATTQRRKR